MSAWSKVGNHIGYIIISYILRPQNCIRKSYQVYVTYTKCSSPEVYIFKFSTFSKFYLYDTEKQKQKQNKTPHKFIINEKKI